jgi:hypothetical protein
MFGWFRKNDIERHLKAKKKIKAQGIEFIIKKIDTTNYLDGSKALVQFYDTYQTGLKGSGDVAASMKKVKEHMGDVILAGVVSPQIGRKPGDGIIHIDELFVDWALCEELYQAIVEFTAGKKKRKRGSPANDA